MKYPSLIVIPFSSSPNSLETVTDDISDPNKKRKEKKTKLKPAGVNELMRVFNEYLAQKLAKNEQKTKEVEVANSESRLSPKEISTAKSLLGVNK